MGVPMEKQSSDNPVCPKCNSTNVAKYLWGLRLLDDQLERDIEEGRVILNCLPFLMSKKWEAVHMRVIMILQHVSIDF